MYIFYFSHIVDFFLRRGLNVLERYRSSFKGVVYTFRGSKSVIFFCLPFEKKSTKIRMHSLQYY